MYIPYPNELYNTAHILAHPYVNCSSRITSYCRMLALKHLTTTFLRHVNEVVIGAPYPLSAEVLDHFKIDVVVRGLQHEGEHDIDPHAVARQRGIFKVN